MKAKLFHQRGFGPITAFAFAVVAVALACAPREDPFAIGDRAKEAAAPEAVSLTPKPALSAEEIDAAGKAFQETLFEESLGIIKIGEWKDDKVKLLQNYIASYIMVYGYDYAVELVETTDEGYKDALSKGDLHLVLETQEDWVKAQAESGTVVDAGSINVEETGTRIGVYGALKQNAPEVMEFLGKMSPGDEIVADLAARITGGRTGIKTNVAALMYLKRHPDKWTSWVPTIVAEKVDAAIKAGKSSLTNRKCIPDGGSGMGDSANCAGM